MLDTPLVVIDLETTGTGVTRDRVTEVGLIEVANGEVMDEWSTLVNPQAWISPFIERHTGITNEMVASAPLFSDIAHDLRGMVLVAHNARFDYGFLVNEFRRCGITFRTKTLCTVQLSRKLSRLLQEPHMVHYRLIEGNDHGPTSIHAVRYRWSSRADGGRRDGR